MAVNRPVITVISTSYKAPTADICKASVADQQGVEIDHRYIEASEQIPPKTCSQNVWEAAHGLPPDRIVLWVDGDDWLAHRRVGLRVLEAHDAGAWVTYGQFVTAAGQKGFAAPYETTDYRSEHWRATHLKTFRAGLLQRIAPEDLRRVVQLPNERGPLTSAVEWLDRAVDIAIMLPILEMAGPKRVTFIPDVLYVYNYGASFEANANPEELAREKAIEAFVRKMPRYAQINQLDDGTTPLHRPTPGLFSTRLG